jgi:hypothetical protein
MPTRNAPRAVVLLLPIWGSRYVSQFLEFGLPMLLAPGNLPAVAGELPTRVVLLTGEADVPLIRAHPSWRRLQQVCAAEIETIDDLITQGNHSATITLAFARAMRACGPAITDTCFILWMSDYLVADGSLTALLQRFKSGASAVFAGNFQVVAEDAIQSFRRAIDPAATSIAISSRELIAWSLAHLHPATVANVVNFGLIHNDHVNRLFWRVDDATLIGRFFLMHPIGIRPEVEDFVIGSSFDYSFVPEMCPSGNIETLTHSDDYFVVEVQKRDHEHEKLLPGPIVQQELAAGLSEWATAQHRKNAEHTVVFQAGEPSAALPQQIAEADAFVAGVGRLLAPQPQPHRNHPYWVGSIAVNRARTGRTLGADNWRFLVDNVRPKRALEKTLLRLRLRVFGTLPVVTRFHPRRPDYALLHGALDDALARGQRLLLLAEDAMIFAHWLMRTTGDIATLEIGRLLNTGRPLYQALYAPLAGTFDACVMLVPEGLLGRADELIERAAALLAPSGRIFILVLNDRPITRSGGFAWAFTQEATRLFSAPSWITEVRYIGSGRIRWALWRAARGVADRSIEPGRNSPLHLLWTAVSAAPLALATCLINLGVRPRPLPPPKIWSSVFLTLHRSLPEGGDASSRLAVLGSGAGAVRPFGDEASAVAEEPAPATARRAHAGSSSEIRARYDFVAELLALRHDVAEYGCVDWFGSQTVSQKVRKFSLYDPDPRCVAEVSHKLREAEQAEARVHDILAEPLPKVHDAIFSLDTLRFVAPGDDEDRYLRNLSRSLSRRQDILILGLTMSGASGGAVEERRGSLASPVAIKLSPKEMTPARGNGGSDGQHCEVRPYMRTGASLKALCESRFETVFLFSMADGEWHSGVIESGDYLFALCSHGKS